MVLIEMLVGKGAAAAGMGAVKAGHEPANNEDFPQNAGFEMLFLGSIGGLLRVGFASLFPSWNDRAACCFGTYK